MYCVNPCCRVACTGCLLSPLSSAAVLSLLAAPLAVRGHHCMVSARASGGATPMYSRMPWLLTWWVRHCCGCAVLTCVQSMYLPSGIATRLGVYADNNVTFASECQCTAALSISRPLVLVVPSVRLRQLFLVSSASTGWLTAADLRLPGVCLPQRPVGYHLLLGAGI